jgi:hypothetical protein
MGLGILAFFFVTDFPDKNMFLTQAQTELVLKRVEQDRGDSIPDKLTIGKIVDHLLDWKLWAYGAPISCSLIHALVINKTTIGRPDVHDTSSSTSLFAALTQCTDLRCTFSRHISSGMCCTLQIRSSVDFLQGFSCRSS